MIDSQVSGICIVAGTDQELMFQLQDRFSKSGHTGVCVVSKEPKDEKNAAILKVQLGSDWGLTVVDDDVKSLKQDVLKMTAGREISNMILCHSVNSQEAVMDDPLQSWRNHSFNNVEVPLGLLSALAPQMSKSTRVLVLSGRQPTVPIAFNGFYAASKIAMECLMHAARLEKTLHNLVSGSIEDTTAFSSSNRELDWTAKKTAKFNEKTAADIYSAMVSPHFTEKDWQFPFETEGRKILS